MTIAPLTIGKVAEQSAMRVVTIRFYERQGLIPEPPRTASGYRQYPASTVDRLRFIARAKELGFSLKEIDGLLSLGVGTNGSPARMRQRAAAKIRDLDGRIRDLSRIRARLAKLLNACPGADDADCPILHALTHKENLGG